LTTDVIVTITQVVKEGHMAERISEAEQAVMEVLWEESPLTAQ
jgi:hypothetical protein